MFERWVSRTCTPRVGGRCVRRRPRAVRRWCGRELGRQL